MTAVETNDKVAIYRLIRLIQLRFNSSDHNCIGVIRWEASDEKES